ncbi:hypothetical protein BJ741DRAFT_376137 [Chytriomyces cf. hyalinus JEL632]|nr:hypothetical protein BJ741DRAFT_376137 [Chytriomyces cf. hyalinus JEL632]
MLTQPIPTLTASEVVLALPFTDEPPMTSALPSPTPSDTIETGKESPNKPPTLGNVFIKTPLQLISSHSCDSSSPLPPSSTSCPPSLTLCPSQSGDDEISLFDFSVTEHRESSSREVFVGPLDVEGGVCGYDDNLNQSGGVCGWDNSKQPGAAPADPITDLIDCLLRPAQSCESLNQLDLLNSSMDFAYSKELDTLSVGSNVSLPNAAATTQSGDVIDQLLESSACDVVDSNIKSSVEAGGSFGFIGDDLASLLDPNKTLASLLAQHSSLAGPMVSGSSHVPSHINSHDGKEREDPLAFLDAFFPPEPQQANVGVSFNDIFSHAPIPDGGNSFYNFSASSSPFSTTSATTTTSSAICTPRNWYHKLTRARLPVLTDVPAKAVKSKTIPVTEPHEPTAPHEPAEAESVPAQVISKDATESEATATRGARKRVAKSDKPALRRSRRAHFEGPVQQSAVILPRPDVMPRVQPKTRKRGKRAKPELTEPPVILPPSAFNTLEACPIRNEFDAEKYLKEAGVPVEACKYCDKVFRRRFDLQRHMKGMHGVSVMSDGALRLENGTGTGREL